MAIAYERSFLWGRDVILSSHGGRKFLVPLRSHQRCEVNISGESEDGSLLGYRSLPTFQRSLLRLSLRRYNPEDRKSCAVNAPVSCIVTEKLSCTETPAFFTKEISISINVSDSSITKAGRWMLFWFISLYSMLEDSSSLYDKLVTFL